MLLLKIRDMAFQIKQSGSETESKAYKEYGEHERELVQEFFNILEILCFYIDPVLKERRDKRAKLDKWQQKKYQKDKYDLGLLVMRMSNFLTLYGYYLVKKKVNTGKAEAETVDQHSERVAEKVNEYLTRLNSFIDEDYTYFLKEFLLNVDSKLGINVKVQKPNLSYWAVNEGDNFEESFRKFQFQRIDFFMYCCDIMGQFCHSLREIGVFPLSNRIESTVDFAHHELFFLQFQKFRVKEQEVIVGDSINDIRGADLMLYQMKFNYINVSVFKTYLSEGIQDNPNVKALFPEWLFKSYAEQKHNEKEYLRAFQSYYYRNSDNTEFKLLIRDKEEGLKLSVELQKINKTVSYKQTNSHSLIRGHTSVLVRYILLEYNKVIQQLNLFLSIAFAESGLIPKQEERFDEDVHLKELPLDYFQDKEEGNTHPHILKIRKSIDVRKINELIANPPHRIQFCNSGEYILEDPDIFKRKVALVIEVLKYNTDCKFIVFSTPGVYSTGSGKSTHAMQIAYSFYYILKHIGAYDDEWNDEVFSRDTVDFMKWFANNIEKFLRLKIIDESKGQKGESANTRDNQKFREVEDTMRKKSYFYGSCQPHLLTLHNAVIMRAKFLVYVIKEKDAIGLMKPSKAYYLFLNNDTIYSYISKRRYKTTEFVEHLTGLRKDKLHTGIIHKKYFYKALKFNPTWCILDKEGYLAIADDNIKETLQHAFEKAKSSNQISIFTKLDVSRDDAAKELLRVKAIKTHDRWDQCKYDWHENDRLSMTRALKRERYPGFT